MQFTVQDISMDMGNYHSASLEKMDEILVKLAHHRDLQQEMRSATIDLSEKVDALGRSRADTSTSSRPPSYREIDRGQNEVEGQQDNTHSLQIRASCYRKTCRPWCSCRCHIRREIRTPGLAKKFIGSLFVGYSGIPVVTEPCNERQCRKRSSSRVIVSYQFPGWFWTRSLLASFMTANVAGPEMLIRISNTIPFASETYQQCQTGNAFGLLRLFENGSASPFDLDPDGLSLLRVSCMPRMALLELTFDPQRMR